MNDPRQTLLSCLERLLDTSLTEDTQLDDLNLDSLAFTELLLGIEDCFHAAGTTLRLEDDRTLSPGTVKDIVDLTLATFHAQNPGVEFPATLQVQS